MLCAPRLVSLAEPGGGIGPVKPQTKKKLAEKGGNLAEHETREKSNRESPSQKCESRIVNHIFNYDHNREQYS